MEYLKKGDLVLHNGSFHTIIILVTEDILTWKSVNCNASQKFNGVVVFSTFEKMEVGTYKVGFTRGRYEKTKLKVTVTS